MPFIVYFLLAYLICINDGIPKWYKILVSILLLIIYLITFCERKFTNDQIEELEKDVEKLKEKLK